MTGIYTITHVESGKQYVGSSVDVLKRWGVHVQSLTANRHHSAYLQRAWNRYGADAFRFDVVEETIANRDVLFERENSWFEELKPVYNMCPVAGSRLGLAHTEDTRYKMSLGRRGRLGSSYRKMPFPKEEYQEMCECPNDDETRGVFERAYAAWKEDDNEWYWASRR